MLVEMLTILFGVSITGWKRNEDVVDQHNKSCYFSDIVDFDIPSKYINLKKNLEFLCTSTINGISLFQYFPLKKIGKCYRCAILTLLRILYLLTYAINLHSLQTLGTLTCVPPCCRGGDFWEFFVRGVGAGKF